MSVDPYPRYPYNTFIDLWRDCYAVPSIHYHSVSRDVYLLRSLTAAEAATVPGARRTHKSACGVCSTLEDLEVYKNTTDLTTPVRNCGLKSLLGFDLKACIRSLGFSD
uniref:Uncharacterized protein n=2 Tax=Emiliania huxleyi TaxID=2903 RepID=A0A0D3I8L8_EMIH1